MEFLPQTSVHSTPTKPLPAVREASRSIDSTTAAAAAKDAEATHQTRTCTSFHDDGLTQNTFFDVDPDGLPEGLSRGASVPASEDGDNKGHRRAPSDPQVCSVGMDGWDDMASHFLDVLLCSRLLGPLICSVHFLSHVPATLLSYTFSQWQVQECAVCSLWVEPGRIELLLSMIRKLAMW